MANIFGVRRTDPPDEIISISDRGTDAMLNILLLAGAALAQTDHQKRLMVWLAEHDRKAGGGNGGFYLEDMPFVAESFEQDRQFMVNVVDAASRKTGWEKLYYKPNEEHLRPMLGWFRKRFMRLKFSDIKPDAYDFWLGEMDEDDPALNGFPCCKEHGIFLSWIGCQICNS